MRHFTPRRAWSPLSDAEWAALAPHVDRADDTPGPRLDRRHRMDAILHNATSGEPWRALPQTFGKPDTVARHFRRLTAAGLWQRLLEALAHPDCPEPLKAIEHWLCRGARRAMRLLKMDGLDLAQRLGFLTALPMVPWMLPNRGLSELAWRESRIMIVRFKRWRIWPTRKALKDLNLIFRLAAGRAVWSKRFAAP